LIVFIRSNPVASDPRVEKEVRSLTAHGFRIMVLAWDREGSFNNLEFSDNRVICRLRFRAPYGKLVVVAYYPIFWLWVLFKLIRRRPEIVHACDLDSIFPALLYRLLKRDVKVVFDVFDSYGLLVEARSKVLGNMVRSIELLVASRSDAFITVSKERLEFFKGAKLGLTEIVMNCPPSEYSTLYCTKTRKTARAFRIVYAGIIASDRGLIELADATKDISDVEFLVAGRIIDSKVLDRLVNFPHVKYVGQLKFDESLTLEKNTDVIPVLYDPRVPINKTATPNKLFEAMMLGVPIITNLPGILEEVQCGINVCYGDIARIRNAILYLKEHPKVRREMGLKGRLAFEQKYNWSIMEKKLIDLYDHLLADQALHYQPFVGSDVVGVQE